MGAVDADLAVRAAAVARPAADPGAGGPVEHAAGLRGVVQGQPGVWGLGAPGLNEACARGRHDGRWSRLHGHQAGDVGIGGDELFGGVPRGTGAPGEQENQVINGVELQIEVHFVVSTLPSKLETSLILG
jgi:hypothetical protein